MQSVGRAPGRIVVVLVIVIGVGVGVGVSVVIRRGRSERNRVSNSIYSVLKAKNFSLK